MEALSGSWGDWSARWSSWHRPVALGIVSALLGKDLWMWLRRCHSQGQTLADGHQRQDYENYFMSSLFLTQIPISLVSLFNSHLFPYSHFSQHIQYPHICIHIGLWLPKSSELFVSRTIHMHAHMCSFSVLSSSPVHFAQGLWAQYQNSDISSSWIVLVNRWTIVSDVNNKHIIHWLEMSFALCYLIPR